MARELQPRSLVEPEECSTERVGWEIGECLKSLDELGLWFIECSGVGRKRWFCPQRQRLGDESLVIESSLCNPSVHERTEHDEIRTIDAEDVSEAFNCSNLLGRLGVASCFEGNVEMVEPTPVSSVSEN
jgi:hypothetical protein